MEIEKQNKKTEELQEILSKSKVGQLSTSDLETLAEWVNCNCALPPRLELQIKEILRKNYQRLEVYKQVVKSKQATRLSKLLDATDKIETILYSPENLESMQPREQLQALVLLQNSVKQAKEFVYDESESVVEVIESDSVESKIVKNFSPASREKIRRAVSRILTKKDG